MLIAIAFAAVWAFILAHGPVALAIAGFVLANIVTVATEHPDEVPSNVLHVLQFVLQLLSVLTPKGSDAMFKLPLTVAPAPSTQGVLPPTTTFSTAPRGFVRNSVLVTLAVVSAAATLSMCASVAFGAEPPPAPAAAAPATPKFGGCNGTGLFCWGPQVVAGLVRFDFKSGDFSGGFTPGFGYGVTFYTGRSYELGLAGYASVTTATSTSPGAGSFSFIASFAEYVRFGAGMDVIGGQKTGFLLGGLGTSFGSL